MSKDRNKKSPGEKSSAAKPSCVESNFPIVGIGASAGGVIALQAFLQEIPQGTGAAYVVIVHLDPTHISELTGILANKAHIPVLEVGAKTPLQPDHIYVIPPNRQLVITDHSIGASAFDEPRGRRAPIDHFFRSLAEQHGDGIAVVLTGAGSDGTLGAKAIKEAGGLILVQDPNEAEYPSMPRSAISTGLADVVLPVRDLARQLVELLNTNTHAPIERLGANDEEVLKRLLTYVRSRTGHDFSRYKRSTVHRRLSRRMQVCKVENLSEYFDLIKDKPEEIRSLFADLLISVTTFFRDAAAFDALAKKVIPKLYDMDEFLPPFASGSPVAPAEKKPIRLPYCSRKKRRAAMLRENCNCLHQTSIATL